MSTPTVNLEVASYTAAVRAELEDLEPDERDDLLEDLEQHLREVAAEGDGTLVDRLGSPSEYAAELRASAGLTSRGTRPALRTRLIRSARAFPGAESVIAFLPELRPGWWVLRAYGSVMALEVVLAHHPIRTLLFPVFSRSTGFGLAVAVVSIWASVALGRAATRSTAARRTSIVLNIGAVVLAFLALAYIHNNYDPFSGPAAVMPNPQLTHPDGSPISNICPYSSDLKPLSGVVLFDQDGRPIDNVSDPQFGIAKGLANVYPRQEQTWDPNTGATSRLTCPTLAKVSPPPAATAVP